MMTPSCRLSCQRFPRSGEIPTQSTVDATQIFLLGLKCYKDDVIYISTLADYLIEINESNAARKLLDTLLSGGFPCNFSALDLRSLWDKRLVMEGCFGSLVSIKQLEQKREMSLQATTPNPTCQEVCPVLASGTTFGTLSRGCSLGGKFNRTNKDSKPERAREQTPLRT